MEIFNIIYEAGDVIISFFYSIMQSTYSDFQSFLTGADFTFNTLIFNNEISFTVPTIDLGLITDILEKIIQLITYVFYPLPFFSDNYGGASDTPFYLCFLSFFVISLILIGLFKLVSFLIELLPFE